jgi:hypothetical protein
MSQKLVSAVSAGVVAALISPAVASPSAGTTINLTPSEFQEIIRVHAKQLERSGLDKAIRIAAGASTESQ